jgi:hypothetical protein
MHVQQPWRTLLVSAEAVPSHVDIWRDLAFVYLSFVLAITRSYDCRTFVRPRSSEDSNAWNGSCDDCEISSCRRVVPFARTTLKGISMFI